MSYLTNGSLSHYRISYHYADLPKNTFLKLGIPLPTSPPDLKGYSVVVPQGPGGMGRYGYTKLAITWDRCTLNAVSVITNFITDSERGIGRGNGNGILHLTIPDTRGGIFGVGWIDVYGVPAYPTLDLFEGHPFSGFDSFVLEINAVQIIDEPSLLCSRTHFTACFSGFYFVFRVKGIDANF